MAKQKHSAFDLPELADIVSSMVSNWADRLEKQFGNFEEPMIQAFQAGGEPMIYETMKFVSHGGEHYRSGDTLSSFNPGTLTELQDGFYVFKFGFDMSKGGFPALILEYGDTGSPKRKPNTAYFFMHWAKKNHVDEVEGKVFAELDRMIRSVK